MAKKIYKGGTTSKTTTRADANHVSHGRKQNLGEAASPTNTKKGQTGKRNTNMQAIWSIGQNVKKTCLLHGPEHYLEKCKAVKD